MASNAELNFDTLPYGKVYLIKSPSDKFLWEVHNQPNLEILYKVKLDLLYSLVGNQDLFDYSYKNYIFLHYPKCVLDLDFIPASNKRLFIWIPTIDGRIYNKSQQEFFKKYNGGVYSVIDLTNKTYLNDLKITSTKETLIPTLTDQEHILVSLAEDEYKHNPLKLNYIYQNINTLTQNNFYSDVICFANLISKLATPKPDYTIIKTMQNFPQTTLKKLLVTPKLKYSELYKILRANSKVGTKNSNLQTLKCDGLWFWYEIFITRIKPRYFNRPHLLLKLFFTWVYDCNTYYENMTGKGFYTYKSYSTINYAFEPSTQAISEFYKLF